MRNYSVIVHSLAFASDFSEYVFNVYTVKADVPAACPEILFDFDNNPRFEGPNERSENVVAVTENLHHSLSVGDAVEVVGEGIFLCAPAGWLAITPERFKELKRGWQGASYWRRAAGARF